MAQITKSWTKSILRRLKYSRLKMEKMEKSDGVENFEYRLYED